MVDPVVAGACCALTHPHALHRPLVAKIRCSESTGLLAGVGIRNKPMRGSDPLLGPLSTKPTGSDGGVLKANGFR